MHFEALNCDLLAIKVNSYFTFCANLCSVLLFNRRFYVTDLSNALLIRYWTIFVYSALQATLGGAGSPERESWISAWACSCEDISPGSLCVCLAISAFSHLENKPEESRLLEWGDFQGFCAIRDTSKGTENYIKGLSGKVCWSQYFSCRNSHRFVMCTVTSYCSLLDSLSSDDPLVTRNRVGFCFFFLFTVL